MDASSAAGERRRASRACNAASSPSGRPPSESCVLDTGAPRPYVAPAHDPGGRPVARPSGENEGKVPGAMFVSISKARSEKDHGMIQNTPLSLLHGFEF